MIDWKEAFINYAKELTTKKKFHFSRPRTTVFYSPENRIELAKNRMRIAIFDHFGLKVYKYKGIQKYETKTA